MYSNQPTLVSPFRLLGFWSFLLFFISGQIAAQTSDLLNTSDLYDVTYFGRSDYKSNDQFHTMIEDDEGYVIFGNNDGILIWDGEHWDLLTLPNFSAVMGLTKDPEGVIWASGFNEVGVLKRDAFGQYVYESRTEELGLLNTDLESIWSTFAYKDNLVLQYEKELVLVKGNVATRIKARNLITYTGSINDKLLLQDLHHGVYVLNLESLELELLFREDKIGHETIRGVFPGRSEGLVSLITAEGGFYELDLGTGALKKEFSVFDPEDNEVINTAITTDEGGYILGTKGSKLIEIRADNSVCRDHVLNPRIKSRTVENLYRDRVGNIWVLLAKGLNYINLRSTHMRILEGIPVFDVLLERDSLYIATNQEVFVMPADPSKAEGRQKIKGLGGQVWSLNKIGDEILVGHQDGLYKLIDDRAELVQGGTGFWGVCEVPDRKDIFLGTTYDGFYLLNRKDGKLVVQDKVEGFDDSTRDLAPSPNDPYTFWVCHGYKGVYRLKFSRDYSKVLSTEFFTVYNGLESPYNILVKKFEDRLVFTTNTGVYNFDDKDHRFVPDKELNRFLDASKNTTFLEKAFDKTWFITDGDLGFYFSEAPGIPPVTIPFNDLKDSFIKTMECVLPLSEDRVLIGNNNGITLLQLADEQNSSRISATRITGVEVNKGETKEQLELSSEKLPEVNNHADLQLRFEYANPDLARGTEVFYSFKLEGHDKEWSQWTEASAAIFSGLSGGNYVFKVKSKGAGGFEGDVVAYRFRVTPAWYETGWAYIGLILLIGLTVVLVRSLLVGKIRKERGIAQKQVEQSEALMRLEMEKYKLTLHQDQVEKEKQFLEKDVMEKSKELANYTLLLSKRKELFRDVYNELRVLRKKIKNTENREILGRVFNKLDHAKIDEKYIEIFDVNFERVHRDFIDRLNEMDVHLTRRELQLCALIKMDLSNKEIAPILNLSVRGVESARYRLRRKLEVEHLEDLKEFFDVLGAVQNA